MLGVRAVSTVSLQEAGLWYPVVMQGGRSCVASPTKGYLPQNSCCHLEESSETTLGSLCLPRGELDLLDSIMSLSEEAGSVPGLSVCCCLSPFSL